MIFPTFVLLALHVYQTNAACTAPGYFKGSVDGRCYKVSSNQNDYYSAARDCAENNAHLATIENAFQQSMIRSFPGIQYPLWIGYNKEYPNSVSAGFRWDYPAATPFTNFNSADAKQHGTCTIIQARGDWWTQPANSRAYYVCQYDDPAVGPCGSSDPNALPFYYDNKTNQCIAIPQTETAYDKAVAQCESLGAELLNDNSQFMNKLIDSLFCWECYNYDQYAYIGLKYINGSFVYHNGKVFDWRTDYSNFVTIDHSEGDCVLVDFAATFVDQQDDTWMMGNCNGQYIGVCVKTANI